MREADARIDGDPDPGHVLGDDRRLSRTGDTSVQPGDKPQIEDNVEDCGYCEECERHHRVPQRSEQRGEEVVEENPDQSREDHDQVILHQFHKLIRSAQEPDDPVDPRKDQDIEHGRYDSQEREGCEDPFLQPPLVLLPEADGEDGTASHGKPQDDGGQEGHKGKGGSDRRQRTSAEKAAYDQRIRDIVALLQKVAQDHRYGEAQHGLHDRTVGQFIFHFSHSFLFVISKLTFVRYHNLKEKDCQPKENKV